MADCDLLDSCFFFNDQLVEMPRTIRYLKSRYCRKDFALCARYQLAKAYGMQSVSDYMFPADTSEIINLDFPEEVDCEPVAAMPVPVMYPDGSTGTAPASAIEELLRSERIVAYRFGDRWIEARRRIDGDYRGAERRKRRAR